MSDADTGPRKFIAFVDCMGYDDIENHMPFVRDRCYDGIMDAGNPYVTPKILGEIYTGENPGVHGMPSVSRYDQPSRLRPAAPTLPEIVAEDDTYDNVCNLGLPFIVPPQARPTGTYWHLSGAMNQQSVFPQEALRHMSVPGPVGDLSDPEENSDLLLGHRMDNIQGTFGAARSLADLEDFDVMFVSTRIADSYCHYRFREQDEDETLSDREYVLREIDHQIEALTSFGDVFVFGDHGATDLENVFKINRWLMENGYLSVDIDHDFIEKSRRLGTLEDPDEPGRIIQVGTPGVEIHEDESVAISDDPFSGGITLLPGADSGLVDQMIDDLTNTPYVDHVDRTDEMWDGPLIDECPDLYPYRSIGTYISGNLAEEMGGPEITRSGVHHPYGGFGSTRDIDVPDRNVEPTELFSLILDDYLGIDPKSVDTEGRRYGTPPESDESEAKDRLRDLGYL